METIVVISVMASIMLILTQIFILNYQIYASQSKRADNDTGAILAAKALAQYARGASNVESSHIFDGTTRTSSDSVLVLKMPSVDATGNIVAAAYDYIAFYRDATVTTKIMVQTDANASSYRKSGARLITAFNQNLIFRYNAADITQANRVSVFLINSQVNRNATLQTKAWTAIFLRNYD